MDRERDSGSDLVLFHLFSQFKWELYTYCFMPVIWCYERFWAFFRLLSNFLIFRHFRIWSCLSCIHVWCTVIFRGFVVSLLHKRFPWVTSVFDVFQLSVLSSVHLFLLFWLHLTCNVVFCFIYCNLGQFVHYTFIKLWHFFDIFI